MDKGERISEYIMMMILGIFLMSMGWSMGIEGFDATKAAGYCLLQSPVTRSCIQSLSASVFPQSSCCDVCLFLQALGYTDLLVKEEEFCEKGWGEKLECGYRHFEILIKREMYIKALIREYDLFFMAPFLHEQQVHDILVEYQFLLRQRSLEADMHKEHDFSSLEKAVLFYYAGNYTECETRLKEIPEQNEDWLEYRIFLRARIYERRQAYTQGLDYMEREIATFINKKYPIHGYIHHLHGNFLMHHLKFATAIKSYVQANVNFVEQNYLAEGFSFTNYNMALCYSKLNQPQLALPFYQVAYLQSKASEVLNALAMCHAAIPGHREQARNHFILALRENPNNTLILLNYGVFLSGLKEYKEAEELFLKCVSLQPLYFHCRHGLIVVYSGRGEAGRVREEVNLIMSYEGERESLGVLLNSLQEYELGLRAGEGVKGVVGRENYAISLYGVGRYEEAEKVFREVLYLGGSSGHLYYNLGRAQEELGKYEEALQSYVASHKLDQKSETALRIDSITLKLKGSDL